MQNENCFCQSCAMPLSQPELFGTEIDGSKNKKYCGYCFKDGAFTQPNVNLEQMIEINAKVWADQDPNVSFKQAKSQMAEVLLNLERWRKE